MILLTIKGINMDNTEWRNKTKGILKAELKKKGYSYQDLSLQLGALGVNEDRRNIANKLCRGTFTAVFFIQCLIAIGCTTIRLDDN